MNREDRDPKKNDGWNTYQGNKGSRQKSETTDDLCGDCDPSHEVRHGDTGRMKNAGEHFWAFRPFRQAVRQKSITNNQSKRERGIWL